MVLTKLDRPLALGGIIETLIRKNTALSYISDGTRIPGDFHFGGSKNLMKRALDLVGRANKAVDKNAASRQRKRAVEANNEQLQQVAG